MKQLKKIAEFTLLALAALVFVIISLPIIILTYPIIYISDKIHNRELKKYLKTIDGKNFFCFNNRKRGNEFLKNRVIPNLHKDIETIYLNGRNIETEKYDVKFLSSIFYKFQNYSRFPHLLKIRGEKILDESINNEFFEYFRNEESQEIFYLKINTFFELENK